MNVQNSNSSKRKSENSDTGTLDKNDFKKIKQETESESESENDNIRSAVKVDEELIVKFEDGLKEETEVTEPKIKVDHSSYLSTKMCIFNAKIMLELKNQLQILIDYTSLLDTLKECGKMWEKMCEKGMYRLM